MTPTPDIPLIIPTIISATNIETVLTVDGSNAEESRTLSEGPMMIAYELAPKSPRFVLNPYNSVLNAVLTSHRF